MITGLRCSVLNAALSLFVLLLSSCGMGNGIAEDLTAHLKSHGILIQPLRSSAPLNKRNGYVVVEGSKELAYRMSATFDLTKVSVQDADRIVQRQNIKDSISIKEAWGASSRPAKFKLKNGAQFEYFYVLLTSKGELYLLVEYAYG
jgi:hypothetical protein